MIAVERILACLPDAKKIASGWIARCPAHDDRLPSLAIAEGREGALLKCHAGCDSSAIVAALGLRMRDLFDGHLPLQVPLEKPRRSPTADEVESALRAYVERFRAEDTVKLGHESPVTSEQLNAARRAVSRIMGIVLQPVPPTRAEMHEILAGIRRALTGRSSLFSVAGTAGLAYVRSRHLNLSGAYDTDVKFHSDWLRCGPGVIFAVRDQNRSVVAVQGRFLDPLTTPKTLSRGSIKSGAFQTPGALDADVLGIVEAPIDAISLALCGLPSLAIMGSSNHCKPWFWLYVKAARIILATDADAAGEKAANELRRALGPARCEQFTFPAGINDVNDYLRADAAGLAARVQAILLGDAPAATEMPSVVALDAYRARRDVQPTATVRTA